MGTWTAIRHEAGRIPNCSPERQWKEDESQRWHTPLMQISLPSAFMIKSAFFRKNIYDWASTQISV